MLCNVMYRHQSFFISKYRIGFRQIMYEIPNWPKERPHWTGHCLKLLLGSKTPTLFKNFQLDDLIKKSNEFPISFPIDTIKCESLQSSIKKDDLNRYIKSAYPIIHEYALLFCAKFLEHKVNHGSEIEQNLYKNMSLLEFIDRLLKKRAVTFIYDCDSYLLRDATRGVRDWETIGTIKEVPPLVLENYISYDEIKLSALLSVSSYSSLINDGNRFNNGMIASHKSTLQKEAVIVGLVGTRLEKRDFMEFQEIIIKSSQNIDKTTTKNLFFDLYEETSKDYKEIINTVDDKARFVEVNNRGVYIDIFDNNMYCKRIAITIDTLLIESNHRAKQVNKMAYIHVVGLGLGVWRLSLHQFQLFVDTFVKRLSALQEKLLSISDVDFSYFRDIKKIGNYKNKDVMPIEKHSNKGIKIRISQRRPHLKLKDPNKLLIVSYAWDGNALPGNEFWVGGLEGSGDSAQAASSQISELHNPLINEYICSTFLQIATVEGDLIPLNEYIKQVQSS